MKELKPRISEQGAKPLLRKVIASAMIVTMFAAEAQAQLSPQQTPSGANKAASADGTIPAWVPPGPQDVGWGPGKYRGDHFKNKDDKALFTITSSNYEKYSDKLSPGQIELFKKHKDYTMVVYPTRRSCGVQDFVAENTKKNVGFAKMDATGYGLDEAYVPGVPFPTPKNGQEVMWNAKMRYRGIGFGGLKTNLSVSPKPGGDWIRTEADQEYYYPWAKKGSNLFSASNQVEAYAYYLYNKPASYAGQAGIFTLRANADPETFIYFPGQRRVRRMPAYTYDSPALGMDAQYNIDEASIWFGSIDRFDFKIVGTKEMYIQYNSFGLYNFKANIDDIAKPNFIDPSQRRYELHRVHVLEATVRSGMRHVAPKRYVYIDEDSWSPAMKVDYDAKGNISKFSEGPIIPVYETGMCDIEAFVQYNIPEGRYLFDVTTAGTGADVQFFVEPGNNKYLKTSFYTSDNLRNISDR